MGVLLYNAPNVNNGSGKTGIGDYENWYDSKGI